MKIYRSLDEFVPPANPVVTQGTFDGVHLGHRKIINRLKELATEIGGETVLITFYPHPRLVLYPDDPQLQLLNTMDEKIELLREAGIQHLIILPFTKEFSRLSSTQFIRDILVNRISVKVLVIGYDHRFGKNREGSFEDLKQCSVAYHFRLVEIPAEDVHHNTVSSTKIRNALLAGDTRTATEYLGRPWFLNGKVVHGDKKGREIGFPTANLLLEETFKLIPAHGVYAVKVKAGAEWYKGMLNIGTRPTFDGQSLRIEVHLIDFEGDLYGQILKVELISRIRDEQRFSGIDDLKKQLIIDKFAISKILEY